ncbi:Cystathionine gamma-synthase [Coemansia sp. RSA 1822]|nr:Cystathionine gamma-synthase [Coemansia sp. RSA 638]KAJ2567104.1 Cystathionine gamma-synthase [Coemansia sp. RSA 1822]
MTMPAQVPLGECVPPNTRHAVSVSLPTWEDNVDYEKGDPRVLGRMRCLSFIYNQAPKQQESTLPPYALPKPGQVRIVQYMAEPVNKKAAALDAMSAVLDQHVAIYCVLFPEDLFPLAKQYWQHTGNGISGRLADYCLHIERVNEECELDASPHYRASGSGARRGTVSETTPEAVSPVIAAGADLEADAYLEERFGRNVSAKYAAEMKSALRRRIAGALTEDEQKHGAQVERGVAGLSTDDVFLTATGMSAVFFAHQALLQMRQAKSVCFGFPYTDTLKILQKFGPGAYFLGNGEGNDYDELERILELHTQDGKEPILAIFTECPSNPLLKTADLPRLRALADRFGVALVVDETIGSFANIDALGWADIVVSSLTKVFSGDSNVMGGSIVLNPSSALYTQLHSAMEVAFEDLMWCEDAIFLERNSRDFMRRVVKINHNALVIAELLHSSAKVANVAYPKFTTSENYQRIMRPTADAGYGGLLSVVFVGGERASQQFFDSLLCCKGPSLGTNFTLASPYTILAHFTELEWAAQYGVSANLVRISVGLEPQAELVSMFQAALDAISEA